MIENFPAWALPALIFGTWLLWAVASAAALIRQAAADGRRRSVSLFPVIPVIPAVVWGIAYVVDWFAEPWGTLVIGSLHVVFVVVVVWSIVRRPVISRPVIRHPDK